MWKRILLSIALLLTCAYLVLALTAFNRPPSAVCTGIGLNAGDTTQRGFISQKEVERLLSKAKLHPVGEAVESVRTDLMEEALSHHPLVDEVECFKTPAGGLCIEVSQRMPILLVMPQSGPSYYIDSKGRAMPTGAQVVAHVPVATGQISRDMAEGPLYEFACYLQETPFWNAQIEQINVGAGGGVELVPRVGKHHIYLGELTAWERKLSRVKRFYRQALGRVGWNKYKLINVEFDNQIICTKP